MIVASMLGFVWITFTFLWLINGGGDWPGFERTTFVVLLFLCLTTYAGGVLLSGCGVTDSIVVWFVCDGGDWPGTVRTVSTSSVSKGISVLVVGGPAGASSVCCLFSNKGVTMRGGDRPGIVRSALFVCVNPSLSCRIGDWPGTARCVCLIGVKCI